MNGVRIRDLVPAGYLGVELRDLLRILGLEGERSDWLVSGVQASGLRSAELESIGDNAARIPGTLLRDLAASVEQVIDGEFGGFRDGESKPWVVILTVDSTYYEIYSTDDVLGRMRYQFRNVEECKYDGKEYGKEDL